MTGADAQRCQGRIITFYSYKGGTGRTMALANVAWLLASNGHQVLTLDWDLESPGLHRYFHPFLHDRELRKSNGVIELFRAYANAVTRRPVEGGPEVLAEWEMARLADIQPYARSLDYPFPGAGGIDFVPSGRQGVEYSEAVSHFNWDDFYDRLGGGAFLSELREEMRHDYDYILIDSRTGLSDGAGICTAFLPDVLVNLFTLNTQSINGAEAIARSVRRHRAREPIAIVPVPTRIEDAEQAKLNRSRAYARQRLDPYVRALGRADLDRYWGSVEIPYKPYYAYEEVLAVFGDRPHHEGTLLSAYERLAHVVTGAPCPLAEALPEDTRTRWLGEFERRASLSAGNLVVSYVARDRAWAEWVERELRLAGQPSTLCEARESAGAVHRADRVLALVSRAYLGVPGATRVVSELTGRTGFDPILLVRLDASPVPSAWAEHEVVEVNDVSADRARTTLLIALGLPVSGAAARPGLPRLPTALPPVWNVPQRNPAFSGRDGILEELRDRLTAHSTVRPVALTGIGGIGKSQIAAEYAHRFAGSYDLVWWVASDQPGIIRTELGRLTGPMRLAGESSTSEQQVEAVLQTLRQGIRYPRWLMVFDGAGDPGALRSFLPEGPGDVIVTTRNPAWMHAADRMEIGVFERGESVELISKRVSSLTEADALAVASEVGHFPLVVEQAAAWLAVTAMPVSDYLTLLATRMTAFLAEQPMSDYPQSAVATWSLSLEELRHRKPAAARLVEMFSCLSAEPIAHRWISVPPMVEELATLDREARDPLLRGSLVRDIARLSLVNVDFSGHKIIMHKLVQSVIREGMLAEVRGATQQQIQQVLASAVASAGGPDDPESWPSYDEVRPHLEESGALSSTEDAVRQLILDMVRYLSLSGDLAGSRELAERALGSWEEILGEADDRTLRMRVYLANTLRAAGRERDSHSISQQVVVDLTSLVGENHPYTLEAMGGLAADMWSLGDCHGALPINRAVYATWLRELGEEHVQTLKAANNLASAERLCGNYQEAARIDGETLERRRRVHGERNQWTMSSYWSYGRDLRELGDYGGSRKLGVGALEACRRAFSDRHIYTIRIAKSLAVTLRRLGLLAEAERLAGETLRQAAPVLGEKHPDTVMCALELACVQSARGEYDSAIVTTREALAHFRGVYGDSNPHTLATANNLAILLIAMGASGKARPIAMDTAERLEQTLGEEHPHTLIAQLNLATASHAIGDYETAARLDERCLRGLSERFDPEHPHVIVARANLETSLRDTGLEHRAQERHQQTFGLASRVLGGAHPIAEAVRDFRRVTLDIEPHPI